MRRVKIVTLVMLCILTAGLCGIFTYGLSGHDSKVYESYGSPQMVLEKEVSLDGIDTISIQYDMNGNDIYIYESEGDFLTIKEYNELDLKEDELSTVTVNGSGLEVKGRKREGKSFQVRIGIFGIRSEYGYVEIGLPASYKGQLTLAAASGEIQSHMDIALEKEFKAATNSGDITIPNITAKNVSLSSTSGDVKIDTVCTDINGSVGTVNITTSSGDIKADQLTGEMDIESTSGEITVKQLTGGTQIKSSSGSIESKTISGNAQFETTSGDIKVQCIDGVVTAEASSGNVEIYEGSGERTVRTTSGDIQLQGVDGTWDIQSSSGEVWIKAQEGSGSINTTSGDVNLELEKLTGILKVDCSSGLAKIRISPDNAFDFKADTSSGDIQTFFDKDLNFSKKGNSAHGTYGDNQSGSSIEVRTTSGDVEVTK